MKSPKTLALTSILSGIVAISTACDSGGQPQQPVQEKLPDIQVQLPPTPNFDEDRVAEKWEDGAYSIFGLRKNIEDRLEEGNTGTEITIKGYVQEIYVAPECPEGDMCPPGKQPHFWITDKAEQKGKKRAMMVVNYRYNIPDWEMKKWRKEPEVMIEVGQRYTIKGKFKRFSDTGFAMDNGLVEFIAYKPVDEAGQESAEWVYPPGSPAHPSEVARMEEQNRKLAERAAKTAAGYKKRKR